MSSIIDRLIDLYNEELHNLNMGYTFNHDNLNEMWELIQIFEFLTRGNPTSEELTYLIEYYD